jgi:hypothetical protein
MIFKMVGRLRAHQMFPWAVCFSGGRHTGPRRCRGGYQGVRGSDSDLGPSKWPDCGLDPSVLYMQTTARGEEFKNPTCHDHEQARNLRNNPGHVPIKKNKKKREKENTIKEGKEV